MSVPRNGLFPIAMFPVKVKRWVKLKNKKIDLRNSYKLTTTKTYEDVVIVRREHTNAEQKKSNRGAICITSTSPVERNNRMLVRVVYYETNLEVRVT